MISLVKRPTRLRITNNAEGFDPNQPRDDIGRWTDSGSSEKVQALHFTRSKPFDRFDPKRIGTAVGHTDPVKGFYFTNNPNYRGHIPEGEESHFRKMEVELSFNKLFKADRYEGVDIFGEDGDTVRDELIKQGYDGVSFAGGDEIVALYPEQIRIKSGFKKNSKEPIAHRQTKAIKLNAKTWANTFVARFLEAGIVSYEDQDCGKALLRHDTIARCAKSFIGKPLINRHSRVTPQTMEEKAGGYISDVYYNDKDGWWYCKGTVHNDHLKEAIKRDGLVSCAYNVKQTARGGTYHNIAYHEEITDFDGEHLAIVDNPRYEGATIRLNSKTKTSMNVFKWFKKDAPKENAGADQIAAQKAAAEAAEAAKAKENSVGGELTADTEIEIAEGQTVKLNDLVSAYLAETEKVVENAGPDADSEIDLGNGKTAKLGDLVANYEKLNSKKEEPKVEPVKENAPAKPSLKHSVIKLARENGRDVTTFNGAKPLSTEDKMAKARELMSITKK